MALTAGGSSSSTGSGACASDLAASVTSCACAEAAPRAAAHAARPATGSCHEAGHWVGQRAAEAASGGVRERTAAQTASAGSSSAAAPCAAAAATTVDTSQLDASGNETRRAISSGAVGSMQHAGCGTALMAEGPRIKRSRCVRRVLSASVSVLLTAAYLRAPR
eukprot:2195221-Pleurochrysis_carterae.AAC.2